MKVDMYIGIDGCRAGWFAVCIAPGGKVIFTVFSHIEKLWHEYKNFNPLILVDIPIGLPYRDIPVRHCDTEARKLLGPNRRSSVFSPPCREAVAAASYEEACSVNLKITGKKISLQTWGIVPKIREVDECLRRHPEAVRYFRESHPEVSFRALNGQIPALHYKKSKVGFEERRIVLTPLLTDADTVIASALKAFRRKEVAPDDILDAMTLAISGYAACGQLHTIPETPQKDACGLNMEIVYGYKK
jgi:predicted RNase H-like nuclease